MDGIFPFCTRKVKATGDLNRGLKFAFPLLHQLCKALENLIHFALLNGFRFAQLIVCLNDCDRLDERRLTRCGESVHKSLKNAFVLNLYIKTTTTISLHNLCIHEHRACR